MSLKLRAASKWVPEKVLLRELARVAEVTIAALDNLLEEHAPGTPEDLRGRDPPMAGSLDQRRAAMAAAHNARVDALVDALGREEAVRVGRSAMAPVGERLGREARERLSVGDGLDDLLRAARVLYRVLGISFVVEETPGGGTWMRVDRCALAEHYTEYACLVLSAADEGVVRGLNPRVTMTFRERITAGRSECLADLEVRPPGGDGP